MIKNHLVFALFFLLCCCKIQEAHGQVLTLKEAVETALANYGAIKAKAAYLKASQAMIKENTLERLPDFSVAVQQAYGTANGQYGPLYGSKGLNVASSGPAFPTQNWNSAFGSLYLANVNWDFLSFGKSLEKAKVAQSIVDRDANDVAQEKLQQGIRVAGAYLNLLAAQRLLLSQQKNLTRVDTLRYVVVARAKNGLIAGVDSSLANAEISNAKIALTRALDYEQEQASQLARLMGVPAQTFVLDTFFISRIPAALYDSVQLKEEHPVLKYYQSRVNVSKEQEKYYNTFKYPTFSLFGVVQGRGSGFNNLYSVQNEIYTHNYWNGINPERGNYLVGVGVTWDLTGPLRVREQVASQLWTSRGLQEEYNLVDQQLKAQLVLANQKIVNAINNYKEAPVQVKAAADAYLQKSVLYKNGLTNIVDVTQALYALNRAETDRDIVNNNVWAALLLKAATVGDLNLFLNEFQ